MKIHRHELKSVFVLLNAAMKCSRAMLVGGKGNSSDWTPAIVDRNCVSVTNPELSRLG